MTTRWQLGVSFGCLLLGLMAGGFPGGTTLAQEPPAINPFGPRPAVREDAVPGYVELSDGTVLVGQIYMTRDKRLKIYDEAMKRQREIPLSAVKEIECKILKEWMEKEYRFRETTRDEKYYTGREYPAREYEHVITLKDGRKISGGLSEILYVAPLADQENPKEPGEPTRVILHKRHKGEIGQTLKQLVYVKVVKLGEEALAEGKRKAGAQQTVRSGGRANTPRLR
ncbi:MAG: hypothetical protein NZ899_06745 [Thermoguttaceae bacterium]|nr:hypothetical protein [Thermoguttaceae bacterium]MDW8078535.1 hypothetical protein [Thermoguttaceae bacterium]